MRDVGQIGDLVGTVKIAQSYKDVAQKYADVGGSLPAEIIDDAGKMVAIYEATATGAAIGGVLGPWGAAAGAVIAGIYSTFDNFGGDIAQAMHDTFNPEHFNEGDYDRMKANCIRSGGIPNWGHAPDNEDGCIYPDGTTSGGDYARHPPQGRQSIRGDDFYDYDLVRDTCPGPFGVPIPLPAGRKCLPGIGVQPIPLPPATLPRFSQYVKAPQTVAALLPQQSGAAIQASRLLNARMHAADKRKELIAALKPGETLPLKAERPYLSASDQAILAANDPPPTPADIVIAQQSAKAPAPPDAPAPVRIVPIVVGGVGAASVAAGVLFFLAKRLL